MKPNVKPLKKKKTELFHGVTYFTTQIEEHYASAPLSIYTFKTGVKIHYLGDAYIIDYNSQEKNKPKYNSSIRMELRNLRHALEVKENKEILGPIRYKRVMKLLEEIEKVNKIDDPKTNDYYYFIKDYDATSKKNSYEAVRTGRRITIRKLENKQVIETDILDIDDWKKYAFKNYIRKVRLADNREAPISQVVEDYNNEKKERYKNPLHAKENGEKGKYKKPAHAYIPLINNKDKKR